MVNEPRARRDVRQTAVPRGEIVPAPIVLSKNFYHIRRLIRIIGPHVRSCRHPLFLDACELSEALTSSTREVRFAWKIL